MAGELESDSRSNGTSSSLALIAAIPSFHTWSQNYLIRSICPMKRQFVKWDNPYRQKERIQGAESEGSSTSEQIPIETLISSDHVGMVGRIEQDRSDRIGSLTQKRNLKAAGAQLLVWYSTVAHVCILINRSTWSKVPLIGYNTDSNVISTDP